jgi:glycosyltransferase involved in cell wall biosynthesis
MTLAGLVWQARALVEVLPKLLRDVKLKIVWRGPMKPCLERRASELGVSERVDFHNNLPKKQLFIYMSMQTFLLCYRVTKHILSWSRALILKAIVSVSLKVSFLTVLFLEHPFSQ